MATPGLAPPLSAHSLLFVPLHRFVVFLVPFCCCSLIRPGPTISEAILIFCCCIDHVMVIIANSSVAILFQFLHQCFDIHYIYIYIYIYTPRGRKYFWASEAAFRYTSARGLNLHCLAKIRVTLLVPYWLFCQIWDSGNLTSSFPLYVLKQYFCFLLNRLGIAVVWA